MKKTIKVQFNIETYPFFVEREILDKKIPISFKFDSAKVKICFKDDELIAKLSQRMGSGFFVQELSFEVFFSNLEFSSLSDVPASFLKDLYDIYQSCTSKLERLFRFVANMWLPHPSLLKDYEEFKDRTFSFTFGAKRAVPFSFPSESTIKKQAKSKLSSHILSLNQLKGLQGCIDSKIFPSDELNQIVEIRDNLSVSGTKHCLLDAHICLETFLFSHTRALLISKGISNKRLKTYFSGEVPYSVILNIILPSLLDPKSKNFLKKYLDDLDSLRKVRNDVVHNGLTKIPKSDLEKFIDSGIKLIHYLQTN